MKILIVDDKEDNLVLLDTLLKGYHYEVEQASNGKEALDKLRNDSYQMVISDILMPVMDGYELCQTCKKDPKLRSIIFVFYTATYTDQTDIKYAQQLGADQFLIKPMEPDSFLSAIRDIVQKIEEEGIPSKKPEITDTEATRKHRDQLLNKLGKKVEELELEIAERKKVEKKLKASLREKEVLLKEIHHRVKNNMQVIASLLNLQLKQVDNKKAVEILVESQSRIRSMALVHERLYQSKDMAKIDLSEYIRDLTLFLFRTYRIDTNTIRLKIKNKDVFLTLDTAIPCGLIVNELISNALKHAFPECRKGEIRVVFQMVNGKNTLMIGDNGIGLPRDVDIHHPKSFGLQLVNTLVEQLDATYEVNIDRGTMFKIVFKEPDDINQSYSDRNDSNRNR